MTNTNKYPNLLAEFLDKENVFAVIGASNNPEKYGYKIYLDLRNAGYKVYPVNPKADEIAGDKAYKSLDDFDIKPDVVDLVVPPKVTENVVKKCKELGIDKVWMQPGAESQKAIEYCRANNIKVLSGICIMVERMGF